MIRMLANNPAAESAIQFHDVTFHLGKSHLQLLGTCRDGWREWFACFGWCKLLDDRYSMEKLNGPSFFWSALVMCTKKKLESGKRTSQHMQIHPYNTIVWDFRAWGNFEISLCRCASSWDTFSFLDTTGGSQGRQPCDVRNEQSFRLNIWDCKWLVVSFFRNQKQESIWMIVLK